ncbi:hypothetical protein EAF04_006723 [Stromatinia cepivora]|nr:hypothetical protein EAF04_006723 [Stromatinia cepivora]
MEIITLSIRTSESNLTVASLQKSYLQLNLAILMDTAYHAHQAEDGELNRTRHAEMLYRKWDEASQKAGNKKVNWSEEVRFGHRWMNWSETLLGESGDSGSIPSLGALLTLSGFTTPSGGSATSFPRRKLNNTEMIYAEAFSECMFPAMGKFAVMLNGIAMKLILHGTIDNNDLVKLRVNIEESNISQPTIKRESVEPESVGQELPLEGEPGALVQEQIQVKTQEPVQSQVQEKMQVSKVDSPEEGAENVLEKLPEEAEQNDDQRMIDNQLLGNDA